MTNRISRLKTALFANTREISLERALLYTASHRQTEGEPVILRRAKATAYILEHVEISIRDEELIAGNRTVKPRAGIMSDAPRDKCTLSCAINGIHAAFHYLKKNYISGCVMTVPTGW